MARSWSTPRRPPTWRFIDVETKQITDNVLVDQRPRVATFTADGAEVWVSSEIGGTVSVIDNATRAVKHKIGFEIPGVPAESIQPVGVAVKSDRSKAYVALGPTNRVAVIDAQATRSRTTCWSVSGPGSSPSRPIKFLYTTNGVSNDISVIDVDADKVTKSVAVDSFPWGVAVKD